MDLTCSEDSLPATLGGEELSFPTPEREALVTTSVEALLTILETAVAKMHAVETAAAGMHAFVQTATLLKNWQACYRRVQQQSDQVLEGVYQDCNWDSQNSCWLDEFNKENVITGLQSMIDMISVQQRNSTIAQQQISFPHPDLTSHLGAGHSTPLRLSTPLRSPFSFNSPAALAVGGSPLRLRSSPMREPLLRLDNNLTTQHQGMGMPGIAIGELGSDPFADLVPFNSPFNALRNSPQNPATSTFKSPQQFQFSDGLQNSFTEPALRLSSSYGASPGFHKGGPTMVKRERDDSDDDTSSSSEMNTLDGSDNSCSTSTSTGSVDTSVLPHDGAAAGQEPEGRLQASTATRFCFVFGPPLSCEWKYITDQRLELDEPGLGVDEPTSRRSFSPFQIYDNKKEPRKLDDAFAAARKLNRKRTIIAADTVTEETGTTSKRKRGCNCKKSKCLKLYCDCFASQINCTEDCNCQNCFNTEEHGGDIRDAQQSAIDRNATAFKPKFEKGAKRATRHLTGCNCKKSGCTKNYCECFQSQVGCSATCKCLNCKNRFRDRRGNAITKNISLESLEGSKVGFLDALPAGSILEGKDISAIVALLREASDDWSGAQWTKTKTKAKQKARVKSLGSLPKLLKPLVHKNPAVHDIVSRLLAQLPNGNSDVTCMDSTTFVKALPKQLAEFADSLQGLDSSDAALGADSSAKGTSPSSAVTAPNEHLAEKSTPHGPRAQPLDPGTVVNQTEKPQYKAPKTKGSSTSSSWHRRPKPSPVEPTAVEYFRWNCNVCNLSIQATSRNDVKRKGLLHLQQLHSNLPHIT